MIKFSFFPCKSNTISSYYKCIRFIFHSQRDMMIPTTMLRDDDIYDLPAIMPKDDETWWYCSNAAGWLDLELVMTIKVYLFKFWGISAYIIEL